MIKPGSEALPKYAQLAREAVQQAYGFQSLGEAGDRVETYVQGIASLDDPVAKGVAKAALTAPPGKNASHGAALLAACELLTCPVQGPLSGLLVAAAKQAMWKPMFSTEQIFAARPFMEAAVKDGTDAVRAQVLSAALKTPLDSPRAAANAYRSALSVALPASANAALARAALEAMDAMSEPGDRALASRGFLQGLAQQTEDAELAQKAGQEMARPPDEASAERVKVLFQSVPRR
ncbi:MAG: hypothetical protein ACYCW6_08040 [Candidatus Xenobia bacterium]